MKSGTLLYQVEGLIKKNIANGEIVSLLVSTTQWWRKYLCYLGPSVDKSRASLKSEKIRRWISKNPSFYLQTQTQTLCDIADCIVKTIKQWSLLYCTEFDFFLLSIYVQTIFSNNSLSSIHTKTPKTGHRFLPMLSLLFVCFFTKRRINSC